VGKRLQAAFTLVELIIVMVLLGVSAILLISRFIDINDQSIASEFKGVVGSVESGSARNFARFHLTGSLQGSPVKVNDDCEMVAIVAALPSGLPRGYSASGETVTAFSGAHTGTCNITHELSGVNDRAVIMLTEPAPFTEPTSSEE